MEKTKNGVVCTQKQEAGSFAIAENFAIIEKFRYVAKLHYIAKISL